MCGGSEQAQKSLLFSRNEYGLALIMKDQDSLNDIESLWADHSVYPTVTRLDIISRSPGSHGKIVTEIIMSESNMHHMSFSMFISGRRNTWQRRTFGWLLLIRMKHLIGCLVRLIGGH